MSQLVHLQNNFLKYLLHSDQNIYQDIVDTGKISVKTRLEIYGNAYRFRLCDALSTHYPALHSYLGDEQFIELAYAYIDRQPSDFRSIRWFGDKLSGFLSLHSDYRSFPYLAELAQVEWTMTMVFDAADQAVIFLETLAKISPEQWGEMCFRLHPSVHFLALLWNVVPLWQSIIQHQTAIELVESEASINWIFWRKDFINQFYSLSAEESYALQAIQQGVNFAEVCEGLCQWVSQENAAMQAASFLKQWILNGLICEVYF